MKRRDFGFALSVEKWMMCSLCSSRTARVGCHKNKRKQMRGVLGVTVFFLLLVRLHTHSLGVWAQNQNLFVFLWTPFFAFSKGMENTYSINWNPTNNVKTINPTHQYVLLHLSTIFFFLSFSLNQYLIFVLYLTFLILLNDLNECKIWFL